MLALDCPKCNASFEGSGSWKPLDAPPPTKPENGLLRAGLALISLPALAFLLLGLAELITGKGSGLTSIFFVVPLAFPAAAVGVGFLLVYALKRTGRRSKA
ncbi:hypothetical protein [Polaromonas sp. YR568]|uniref:hypothetical protein n=1 Tax=Polaromonas sp. YR568 TaxID=1855301 RepID=UPI0031382EE0